MPFASLGVRIREMRESDLPLIVSTWPRFQRPACVAARDWGSEARRAILALIRRANVVVLCSVEHESTIEGWSAGIGGTLLGIYIRPSYLRHAPHHSRALSDALIRHAKEAA